MKARPRKLNRNRLRKASSLSAAELRARIKAARYHILAARYLREAEACKRPAQRKAKSQHMRLALKHLQQARAIILKASVQPFPKLARTSSAA